MKTKTAKVKVLNPHPDADTVPYVIRRALAPAEEGEEVWNCQSAPGPSEVDHSFEATFPSFSDPDVFVTYEEGEGEYDRFAQFTEMRFSCPRFIALGALEDGFSITVMESDGAAIAIGNALIWMGRQMLRHPAEAAALAKNPKV
jgi:hypothetical protein